MFQEEDVLSPVEVKDYERVPSIVTVRAPYLRTCDEQSVRKCLNDFEAYGAQQGKLEWFRLVESSLLRNVINRCKRCPNSWIPHRRLCCRYR